MLWYKLTNYLGILSILVGVCFALLGLVQLIRRRSLLKVDREILILGGLYVVLALLYVLFEFVVISERPIIMPGDAHVEASFPSSHTMLAFVILGSAMPLLSKYEKRKGLRTVLRILCAAIIAITVIGRLVSGVHWFTDILGGVLISAMLLNLYAAIWERKENHE